MEPVSPADIPLPPSPPPTRPPGLPVASRLALSLPPLVSLVLAHLAGSVDEGASSTQRPPSYAALCSAALVARVWANAARPILQERLFFDGGSAQLEQWLWAVEIQEEDGTKARNRTVTLLDPEATEMAEGEGAEKAKWSVETVRWVLKRLQGVESLMLGFFSAKSLPADLLAVEELKDLRTLYLGTALRPARSHTAFPFRLMALAVHNQVADPSRDWSFTFSVLSPSLCSLQRLEFSSFHFQPYEPHLFPALAPSARTLSTLELPYLQLSSSSWRLALFALLCTSLRQLSIGGEVHALPLSELLPLFRRAPIQVLALQQLAVPVGAGLIPPEALLWPDPLAALYGVLREWTSPQEDERRKALYPPLKVQSHDARERAAYAVPRVLHFGCVLSKEGSRVYIGETLARLEAIGWKVVPHNWMELPLDEEEKQHLASLLRASSSTSNELPTFLSELEAQIKGEQ
ncbi:hypothetical protein JCM10213_007014, partial [Rhodosporidiobolus nylandii]